MQKERNFYYKRINFLDLRMQKIIRNRIINRYKNKKMSMLMLMEIFKMVKIILVLFQIYEFNSLYQKFLISSSTNIFFFINIAWLFIFLYI
jgi:hypothetical protein